ncbi:microfibril-associated glycoprotein 4-like [Silurus meridionalis]|nr:microfibril-associated glycoprotein 4-like [Silurus meridionalis]
MLVLLMVAVTSLVHSAPVINISLPLDCEDVYNLKISTNKSASVPSGVYTIYPAGPDEPVTVYCDMGCGENNSHQDGKWTVIQRRIDGNVSFYQPWEQYKNGFGDANGEYWIGLRNIFLMTYREKYQLKVNIEDFEDGNAYAQYTFFYIDPESNNYRLNIGGYIDGGAEVRQEVGGGEEVLGDCGTTAEVIKETVRKVLGVTSGNKKEDKETWWWNEEVQESRRRKRLEKQNWNRQSDEKSRQENKEMQQQVKRDVVKAKEKAYEEL